MRPNSTVGGSFALAFLLGVGVAAPAVAGDGAIEINQARALAGGVTDGDAPGFPVEIHAPGSFRLTGDLDVPPGAGAGIAIYAAGAQLDLGGHAVASPNCSPGLPPACANPGVGIGIDASGAGSVVLRNGRVSGFGAGGAWIFDGGRVTDLVVEGNGGTGILADEGSTITGNTVRGNGGAGIEAGASSRVAGNVADRNAGHGISGQANLGVERNVVTRNLLRGITVGNGSHVVDNDVSANGRTGVGAGSYATVGRNTVTGNLGCGIALGGRYGLATRNHVTDNEKFGLWNQSGLEQTSGGNTFQGNRGSSADGSGTQIGWFSTGMGPSNLFTIEPNFCNTGSGCGATGTNFVCP